ncbi:hypothetical protein M9458_051251, partial [Cirrhinus mrigala]
MGSSGDFSRLTLKHGLKCMPDDSISVEDVLIAVSRQVGGLNIKSASRMNKSVVVFLTDVKMVDDLIERGITINDTFLPVLPLSSPSKKIVLSNVPPFIKNEVIQEVLERYGKLTAPIKMIPLGLKNPDIKHVMSFRRYTYMILNEQQDPLNLAVKLKNEETAPANQIDVTLNKSVKNNVSNEVIENQVDVGEKPTSTVNKDDKRSGKEQGIDDTEVDGGNEAAIESCSQ